MDKAKIPYTEGAEGSVQISVNTFGGLDTSLFGGLNSANGFGNLDVTNNNRRLQGAAAPPPPASYIRNPIFCVKAGALVVFDVNPTTKSYPVYMKDYVASTNPNFDYGNFIELESQINKGIQIRMWAHEFTEKGTYAFQDSKKKNQMTIISVKAADEECPSDEVAKPMTEINLSQAGVLPPTKEIVPNYTFMVFSFVMLLTCNFFIAFAIVWLNQQNHAQENDSIKNIYYDLARE
jgi:hypothetical protein